MALLRANGTILARNVVRDTEGRYILREARSSLHTVRQKIAQNDPRLITDVDKMIKLKDKLAKLRIASR